MWSFLSEPTEKPLKVVLEEGHRLVHHGKLYLPSEKNYILQHGVIFLLGIHFLHTASDHNDLVVLELCTCKLTPTHNYRSMNSDMKAGPTLLHVEIKNHLMLIGAICHPNTERVAVNRSQC